MTTTAREAMVWEAQPGGVVVWPPNKSWLPPCGGHPTHVVDRRYIEHRDGTASVEGALRSAGGQGFLEDGVRRQA